MVDRLHPSPAKPKSKRRRPAKPRPLKQKQACLVGVIAVAGLGLSLSHLGGAIQVLTNGGVLASLLLAVVIDAGMMASELSLMTAGKQAKAAARVYLIGATALSMTLNAFEFGRHSSAGLGFALSRATLWDWAKVGGPTSSTKPTGCPRPLRGNC